MISLHLFDTKALQMDKSIQDCDVVFKGTHKECEGFAVKNGWSWVPDVDMLFFGYYKNKKGDVLFPC